MGHALEGLRVIDADTHLTEAHDLWTKRAPAKYKDRVPHVVDVEGKPMWYVDDVRDAVLVLGRGALGPQVVGLGQVGVRVDHPQTI